jgi:uncharacterized membrane protein
VTCEPENMELPRPRKLLRTVGLSLTEAIGFPIAAYAIGGWLGGRDAGLLAGLGAICITAVIRRLATGSVPGLVTIMVIVLAVQTAAAIATGNLWIFLVHFPIANLCLFIVFARTARGPDPLCARLAAEMVGLQQPAARQPGLHRFFQRVTVLWAGVFLLLAASMAVFLETESTATFLLLSAVDTVALIAAGTGASVLWIRSVLRRLGIRVRYTSAATV